MAANEIVGEFVWHSLSSGQLVCVTEIIISNMAMIMSHLGLQHGPNNLAEKRLGSILSLLFEIIKVLFTKS